MAGDDLWRLGAAEAVDALRRGDLRPQELVHAAIARIEAVDGAINALPIRCFDRALKRAAVIEAAGPADDPRSLCGLPIAVKDYNDVGGVRSTYGSPIFADNVPPRSDATVAALEARGAIPIAKSNVPEWAGGHTFNPVHGLTRNPWHTGRSAGGSSGGSAAALASGQVWLATGNDLGGSLRTPAGFNGVVGLRPGPGVVPRGERLPPFDTLWVEGPMARSVEDVALMLDAGAGHAGVDPLSFDPAVEPFRDACRREPPPARIGYSADLGIVPVSREVAAITGAAAGRLAAAGFDITDETPDFGGAPDAFQTLRGVLLATMMGELLERERERIAADIVGNIELGLRLSAAQVFEAERARWRLSQRMGAFFQHHDALICPSASVAAFPVEQRYVTEIDGTPCATYIDWFAITFALTLTACPVISIPCGITDDGLPVGLQVVGRPRDEGGLLALARVMEQVFAIAPRLPVEPGTRR